MNDFKDELTDLTGKHLESFIALLIKSLPGNVGNFGVGHRLNIEGDNYRYYFVMAQEGHPVYDQLEMQYEQTSNSDQTGGENR